MTRTMKTLVVGLGNPILTDDGVGVKVAYAVAAALDGTGRDDVTVTEASVGGLRLMELLVGYDRAIVIDALIDRQGTQPGTIQRFSLEHLRQISPTQHSASAHDTNLVTALDAGRQVGLLLPNDITIYAVCVENIMDFGEEPTPAVAAAIPQVTAAVLAEL